MSSAPHSAGREKKSLLEKNVILTECASKVFHSHGAGLGPRTALGPHLWGERMLVVIRVLWSACFRETAGGTDRWTDGHEGRFRTGSGPEAPPSAFGLSGSVSTFAGGSEGPGGAVWLWGFSEAGPVFAPHIHPGAGAHGWLPPRTGHWPCQLSAPATRSVL